MRAPTLLYRGPLERSRLMLLLEAAHRRYGPPDFLWLVPGGLTEEAREWLAAFERLVPFVRSSRLLDGRLSQFPRVALALRRQLAGRDGAIVAVGFSALVYASATHRRPLIWCINGIPEEDLLERPTRRAAARVAALWRSNRLARRPDLVVTVSGPMANLIHERVGSMPTLAVPTCVDIGTFAPREQLPRRYLTYLGTGAPWQGLHRLNAVWQALHRADPSLRFRIVSRDPRTRVLATGLPEGAVDFRASEELDEVARFLWEAEAGFLLREPNLVNRVSFPTKLGEYVAAGAYVVTSDFDWDVRRIVLETGCGVLCPPDASPAAIAEATIAFRRETRARGDIAERCRRAAAMLDRELWADDLARALPG